MLARYARPHDPMRGTAQKRELSVPSGSPPKCDRGRLPSESRALLTLFLLCALFAVLPPNCSANDQLDAPNQNAHFRLVSAARAVTVRPAHDDLQTTHLRPFIEQVRFNQTALPFDDGVTIGPGAGTLEIRFTTPSSGASAHLRYRLIGLDTAWKEAGKEREALYSHLAPGRYELDFEASDSGNWRSSVVGSLPITVIEPYWKTGWFRSLCVLFLAFVIFVLHKLRVGTLVRHSLKLQEAVNKTKAELTLAAKVADDAQEALKEQALRDGLTGLWNRRAVFAMLEREICRAQRDEVPVTLLMIDMDHFKTINDTHGHLIGDEVLREAANRLVEVMRPYDFAGRYGGEEFLVVLPSCSPQNGIQRAEDFRRAIAEKPMSTALGPLTVTCSLGVAAYDGAMSPEDLIHHADQALYRAKRLGRNRVAVRGRESSCELPVEEHDPPRPANSKTSTGRVRRAKTADVSSR